MLALGFEGLSIMAGKARLWECEVLVTLCPQGGNGAVDAGAPLASS